MLYDSLEDQTSLWCFIMGSTDQCFSLFVEFITLLRAFKIISHRKLFMHPQSC